MKTIYALILLGALAGCATTNPTKPVDPVIIDKPVVTCPTPPTVPKFTYTVDALTAADQADPGKVAQAYKRDMIILRSQVRIYEMIVNEYGKASVNFDAVNAEIANLVDGKYK